MEFPIINFDGHSGIIPFDDSDYEETKLPQKQEDAPKFTLSEETLRQIATKGVVHVTLPDILFANEEFFEQLCETQTIKRQARI